MVIGTLVVCVGDGGHGVDLAKSDAHKSIVIAADVRLIAKRRFAHDHFEHTLRGALMLHFTKYTKYTKYN